MFGPLARYLDDPAVTDVFVNGHRDLWVDRGAGPERAADWSCPGEERLREFAVRLVAAGGRHIDESTPCVDVRVAGRRVHVVLPPLAVGGTLISVRVAHLGHPTLSSLRDRGFFGPPDLAAAAEEIVAAAVRDRTNVLITGAAGSGKTTFLSALLASADEADRIVVIEDVTELRVAHPHVVALQARQPNLEGAGGIGLAELVRQALRMRPDRLVLGECRGAEIRELLSALNTGHDGGAGTLHANALADVPARLEALGALAGLDAAAIARQTVSAIGLVCHLRRTSTTREIASFGRFALDARDRLTIHPLPLPAPPPPSAPPAPPPANEVHASPSASGPLASPSASGPLASPSAPDPVASPPAAATSALSSGSAGVVTPSTRPVRAARSARQAASAAATP